MAHVQDPLLAIESLSVALPPGADRALALREVSLELHAGEVLCLAGESGSGKSLLAGAVMGLLPPDVVAVAGRIQFGGQDLLALPDAGMRKIRGARIAMIFQEPMTALNPLHRIGDQIAEMFSIHTAMPRRAARARVLQLLADVQIPEPAKAARAFPHELSGGQRQRAMIAMALALEPAVLIADEPTTALDVTTQARILALIKDLQRRKGTAVLFITHDFGVVAEIADRVAVMRAGEIVEQGAVRDVLERPRHDYTKALLAAVPSMLPPPPRMVSDETILRIEHLNKVFRSGGLLSARRTVAAVKDVSLVLPRGGTLGIVGESGSGKSTLARCIVRLLDPDTGHVWLDGIDLAALSRREMKKHRQLAQMVFQDPFGSLDPRQRVGELVAEGMVLHGVSREKALARVAELFALVRLDPASVDRYPHEFSGGQRQRIGLARALALEPKVLVADEPVSALDVSVQAQVLRLLADLRETLGLSMVFITHDLRVAAQICDFVAVMKDGEVVETGATGAVFAAPQHGYARALLASVPGKAAWWRADHRIDRR